MKKILALVLCLMMAFTLTAAADDPFMGAIEGTWVQFEDGFELYLPSEWVEYECTDEMYEQGIFYTAGSQDGVYYFTLSWKPLEAEVTIEEACAQLATVYPTASVVEVNGVGLAAYTDTDHNLLTCVAMDAAEPGMYIFNFYPAEDEDFQILASMIASSIRNF